jgi:acetyl esterase/lipase
MVMGKRPDVPVAGMFATVRALVGMLVAIARAVVDALRVAPWRGAHDPGRAVAHELLLRSMKGFMTYAVGLPTPELRSVEIVIDDAAGLALPLPWVRRRIDQIDVSVGGVSGQWVIPRDGALEGVVLYLHGGGYVATTPRMYGAVVAHLALATDCATFLPDYRLAPEFPYPAPLDDARAVYLGLLDHVDADRIVVAGDSGGGGLTAALLEDLPQSGLPQPAGAILFSPEIDLALTGQSITDNAPLDILPDIIPVEPYLQGVDARDPAVSPLYADLRGYPPFLVTSGGTEMFRDEIREFVVRAGRAGVDVDYFEAPEMEHVFEILSPLSRSSSAAFSDVRDFTVEVLSSRIADS